jgi:hypothetical protein
MTEFQPAILVLMSGQEVGAIEVFGQAIVTIFRNAQGLRQASGTFRSSDERLGSLHESVSRTYEYRGVAYEGSKQGEIAVAVSIKQHKDDLYEIEGDAEPIILNWPE